MGMPSCCMPSCPSVLPPQKAAAEAKSKRENIGLDRMAPKYVLPPPSEGMEQYLMDELPKRVQLSGACSWVGSYGLFLLLARGHGAVPHGRAAQPRAAVGCMWLGGRLRCMTEQGQGKSTWAAQLPKPLQLPAAYGSVLVACGAL